MKVEIIFTVDEVKDRSLKRKTAVVIDTLRATSTIVTALYNGADVVEPKIGISEVLERAAELNKACLLGGERHGIKVDDFDLGNSPLDYNAEDGDDRVQTACLFFESYRDNLSQLLRSSANGIRLISIGHEADIDYCARLDCISLLCYFDGKQIRC